MNFLKESGVETFGKKQEETMCGVTVLSAFPQIFFGKKSLQILDAGLWDAASWEYRFLEILRYNLMGEGVSKSSLLQHCYTV